MRITVSTAKPATRLIEMAQHLYGEDYARLYRCLEDGARLVVFDYDSISYEYTFLVDCAAPREFVEREAAFRQAE